MVAKNAKTRTAVEDKALRALGDFNTGGVATVCHGMGKLTPIEVCIHSSLVRKVDASDIHEKMFGFDPKSPSVQRCRE